MRHLQSLTARLVLTVVSLVAVVVGLIAVATAVQMRAHLSAQLDQQIEDAARAFTTDRGPGSDRFPGGFEDPSRMDFGNQSPGTLISTDTGQVIITGRGFEEDQVLDAEQTKLALGDPSQPALRTVDIPRIGRYRIHTVSNGSQAHIIGLPTEDLDQAMSTLVIAESALAALGVLSAAAAGTFVVRRQLAPLRQVAATAHAVAETPLSAGAIDLTDRVPDHLTDSRNEVGQVGSALNTLLDHVESSLAARHQSEQQVRQFVADASHELRTPLATIVGYTELAHRQPDATATALAKVQAESARMTALVEDLLLLARLDSGRGLADEPVDLTKLLLEAVDDARVVAPDHDWQLRLPEEPIEVRGDEQRLHQVVTNLLTNARKHTPPGTTVTITATADGFSVHDDGPGFPSDLVAHAFERFARAGDGRSRATGSGDGAGLGLALVEAIVSAHGGRVTLESAPADTTITVDLP